MPRVHFNIGSNLGDRQSNIARAIAQLERLHASFPDKNGIDLSRPVESAPWGFESANMFINVGLSITTDIPPLRLLTETQRIERSIADAAHRDSRGNYIDRAIDIDIIFYGDTVIDSPELTLPHPRALLRDFVITPLCDTDPDWTDPQSGIKACQIRDRLSKK